MTGASHTRRPARQRVRRGVIGIIASGSAYLMIRRAPGVARGGYWCFPGGHVEPSETSRQAVQRELVEELGIDVVATQRVGSVLRIRRASTPEPQQVEPYELLDVPTRIVIPRKTWSDGEAPYKKPVNPCITASHALGCGSWARVLGTILLGKARRPIELHQSVGGWLRDLAGACPR